MREPTLHDKMMMGQFAGDAPPLSVFRAAARFVLDKEASTFMGEINRQAALEVICNHEFARSPYPTTWIEMDHRKYWGALTGQVPDIISDRRIGVLVHDGKAYVAVDGDGTKARRVAVVIPFLFNLGQRMDKDYESRLLSTVGMSLDEFVAAVSGLAYEGPTDRIAEITQPIREAVRSNRPELFKGKPVEPKRWRELFISNAGNLKLVLALLLMLTRPGRGIIQARDVPREIGLQGGRRKVFLEHHSVSIRLERQAAIRRAIAGLGEGIRRRRHSVRGHWCQTRRHGLSCAHEWQGVDEDHYECRLGCGARRWWREHCWRGSFEQGIVSKDSYEVHR